MLSSPVERAVLGDLELEDGVIHMTTPVFTLIMARGQLA